jgi:hypothetical protein
MSVHRKQKSVLYVALTVYGRHYAYVSALIHFYARFVKLLRLLQTGIRARNLPNSKHGAKDSVAMFNTVSGIDLETEKV